MRPLRYSINVTLDGCCDHRAIPADEDLHRHAVENLDQADALLFGRVTYQMMEAAFRPPARTGARPDWMEPLRAVLRFLRVSPSRFQAWRRRQTACALDDQSSCPRTSPHRLTPSEVQAIGDMVTSPESRHVPTGTLAVLAQRLGTVSASPSTWYRLVRKYGWRRPRLRVHPAKPKVGLRTTGADEMWHIDTTVIRLLDGTRAYLHAVIDNFSRRILAWRVADTFAPVNSVAVLLEASRGATRSASAPVVLADAGVENVNAQVDALIDTGVLRRLLAFTELKFSNSMIEAWWRSLKHQWLFLHPLDSVATIRRLVAFYVLEHNHVLPHSACRGQTPDEMYSAPGTRCRRT